MDQPQMMVELWRGDLLESAHCGHAVVCDASGRIVESWGNPQEMIYPRSSCKMIQALPMVESGLELTTQQLALASASHQGAPLHVDLVRRWLDQLGLSDGDLRCGPQTSRDPDLRTSMIRDHQTPCRVHNNCSGKHAGFLAFAQSLGAGLDYVAPDHPVQQAVRAVTEELTEVTSPCFGIDGCSAPNFATTMHGLARSMAKFASATEGADTRQTAMVRLREATMTHPDLVAGHARACTDLMRAAPGQVSVKTGAEGVFVAVLPDQKLGVALKIVDGATRASEAAIAALLAHLGVLAPDHPEVLRLVNAPIYNFANLEVGRIKAAPGFPA